MSAQLICEGCGRKYWPQQWWVHEGCAVNHQPKAKPPVVVNTDEDVVVNRSKDRHTKCEHRTKYMKDYMQRRRAKGG